MNNNIKIIQKASLGSCTTQIGVQYNYYGTDSNINEEIDITDRIKNIVKHKKEQEERQEERKKGKLEEGQ